MTNKPTMEYPIYRGPLHMCGYCQTMFISEEFLGRHQKKCNHAALHSLLKSKLQLKRTRAGIHGHSTKSKNVKQIQTSDGDYFCDRCFSGFLQLSEYEEHLRERHPNECDQFERMSIKKKQLQFHTEVHQNDENKFICDECSEIFKTNTKLLIHKRIHTGEKTYKCDQCIMEFIEKKIFVKHLTTHTMKKRFGCSYCPMKFSHKCNLITHLRTHTGEKPFGCAHCQMKFSRRGHLTSHLLTHTGEKPFDCPHCQMKFARRASLTTHLWTHTGEKRVSCAYCPMKFTLRRGLNRHLRNYHRQQLFNNIE